VINIEVISKPRGNGKTYDLIMKSAETGTPILTAFEPRYIVGEANRLGVKIPEPMSISRYKFLKNNNGFNGSQWNGKLLIDDVECVLRYLLDAEVDTVTVTSENESKTLGELYDELLNEMEKIIDEQICKMNTWENFKGRKYMNTYSYLPTDCSDSISWWYRTPSNGNEIKDVNIIVPDKVVEVIFADGTKTKSVCLEPDVFSLETAISICLSKKIMGGSSAYNNAVKRGVKVYEDKLKKIETDKAEQERITKKKAKREEYKKRRAAKREAVEKEKAIAIQTEAYIRAMEEMESRKNGKNS
jgi:nitrogen regulatory protein PII-like uncharacterized protein